MSENNETDELELSFNDIRDLLSQALNLGSGDMPCCWVRDVYPQAVVYQDDKTGKLFKRSYTIDDKRKVTLGDAQPVVQVTEYEPVEMAAFDLEGDYSDEGDYVTLRGKIFQAGNYEDKKFSLTPEEMKAAVASFKPVPIDLAHASTPLDGKLGTLEAIEMADNGQDLIGVTKLPKWLDKALGPAARKVSCTWNRATKTLEKLALVNNPRIPDAVLTAAYSEFCEEQEQKQRAGAAADDKSAPTDTNLINPNPPQESVQMSENHEEKENSAALAQFEAMKAQFEAQKAEIERLKAANRRKDAEAFAESEIAGGRALPAERVSIIAAFERAAMDDEANPVEVQFAEGDAGKGNRVAMLKAMYASRPAHKLTQETVREGEILFSQSPKQKEQAEKDAEEARRLMEMTNLGKQALKARAQEASK